MERGEKDESRRSERRLPPGMGDLIEGEIFPGTGIAVDDAVESDNDEDLEPADPAVAGCPPIPAEEENGEG